MIIINSGIYSITNLKNNKKYIGQTHDFKYRWQHHRSNLNGGIHHNRHLQNAWNKYGASSFQFDVVEYCSLDMLDDREKYWINFFDTLNKGYNLDEGGKGIRGYKHTDQEIEKMRRIQNPEIVLQFSLQFELVQEWIGGACHIEKTLHIQRDRIVARCEHSVKNMTPYKNYYWVFKREYEHPQFQWENYLKNKSLIETPIKLCKSNKKDLSIQFGSFFNKSVE